MSTDWVSKLGKDLISSIKINATWIDNDGLYGEINDTHKYCKKCGKFFVYTYDDETYTTMRKVYDYGGNIDLCVDCDKVIDAAPDNTTKTIYVPLKFSFTKDHAIPISRENEFSL